MNIFFLIMILSSVTFSQTIEDGWKGIKPLKTSRTEVEKLLGKPEIDDNGYHRYRTDEAFVRVNYSTTGCKDNQYKRGRYNVPEDTVLDYYVVINDFTLLSDLKIKKENYYRDASGDVENNVVYVERADTIIISVHIQQDTEYVGTIYYQPQKEDKELYKCDEPTAPS